MATLAPVPAPANLGRDQLILRYAPLVRRAVGPLARSRVANLDAEDIYGYGTMGLIDAIDRFDASRGVKFETYAVTRIRGYLLDQLRAFDWLPRSARAHTRSVLRAGERLEARLGRHPSHEELARETGLPPDVCQHALSESSRAPISLDELLAAHEESSPVPLAERLEDEHSPNPLQASERRDLRRVVRAALTRLPGREATVLGLRYDREWSLKQVAAYMGVSESRASQIHTQALARMRQILSAAEQEDRRSA